MRAPGGEGTGVGLGFCSLEMGEGLCRLRPARHVIYK
jgi:hypothetical protein